MSEALISPRHRVLRRALGALAGLLMAVTVVGVAYPLYWNHRATAGGAALLDEASLASSRSCPTSVTSVAAPAGGRPGVLEIPAIGLVAPVLQGLSDSVLNIAVGHDPVAPWPGQFGESMFEAHDVSYFAHLSSVRPGDLVIWQTTCLRAEFRVKSVYRALPGAVIEPPPAAADDAGLALVTCWPTNALYWTPKRYVVATSLVSTSIASRKMPSMPSSNIGVKVGAPPQLAVKGLDLGQNTNYLQLGVLHLAAGVSSSWAEGPGPIEFERDALETYFGAKRAAAAHNSTWWRDLTAPGLAVPGRWPSFGTVDVTLTVRGSKPLAVQFTSPGVSASFVVIHSTLVLSRLS